MKKEHINENERGIAIIFTLGLLALFTMTALLYTVTSTTNRKTAQNYNAQTRSRISAQTGLQRAVAHLNYAIENNNANRETVLDYLNSGALYSELNNDSIDEVTKTENLTGSNSLLNTVIDDKLTFYNVQGQANSPTWQYFPANHSTNIPITSRIAYIILPEFGKLDPAACIDIGANAVSEDNETNSSNGVVGRPGRNINELFLETLFENCFPNEYITGRKLSSIYAENINSQNALKLHNGNSANDWIDIYDFIDKVNIYDDDCDSFKQLFCLESTPTPEAFWIDDGDNIQENGELYHRFNLTMTTSNTTNWDNITVNDLLVSANAYSSSQGGGINWLSNWKDEGTFNDAATRAKQIAANIIDYNDTNPTVTTDNANNPTYVGLEKCPYINELNLEFTGNVSSQTVSEDGFSIFAGGALAIVGSPGTLYLSNGHANGALEIGGLYGGSVEASGTFSSPATAFTYSATVTTEILGTQSTPSMPQSMSWYESQASSNSTSFSVDLTISNDNNASKIYIEGSGIGTGNGANANRKTVFDDCVIYTTGNITIDDDLNRTVTLVAEGNVTIDPNLEVSITPAEEDTLIYAGGRVDIDYCDFEASGIIKADAEIEILNSTLSLTNAYLWSEGSSAIKMCNGTISGGGGSGNNLEYICNVYLKKAQLEVVDMYSAPPQSSTTDPLDDSISVNCLAEITIEGLYNWIIDGTDSEVNFSQTFNLGVDAGTDTYSYNLNSDLINLDISPLTTTTSNADISTSIEDFQITNLKVKLTDANSNLLDFSYIEPSTVYISSENEDEDNSSGVTVDGDLNINPGSSNSNHPFTMQTPGGEIDIDDLRAWSVSDTYSGTATEIKIKAKRKGQGGTSLTINGETVYLHSGTYYTFTGTMTVSLYNSHSNGKAQGNWWIDISGSNISIDPGFTGATVSETEEDGGPPTLSSDGSLKSLYFNYQVADPRQNLNPEDWGGSNFATETTTSETSSEEDEETTSYPEWVQPTGAHDCYNIGDQVLYNGTVYESLINGNSWSPDAYPAGWQEIEVAEEEEETEDTVTASETVYISCDTLGAQNTGWIPVGDGVDSDKELNVNPWEISTAYISDSPMQSPWELGFIHRGAAFQTLNLKKYNSNYDIGTGGGEDYSSGDANILDQIKMTSEIETLGKININTKLEKVLTLLFEKIQVGSDKTNSDGPGTLTGEDYDNDGNEDIYEINSTHASALASEVLNNSDINNGSYYLTRAQIVRDTNSLANALSTDGTVQGTSINFSRNTDARQEEIIGKFINLTDASVISNVFNIIVVVQAIQDVGSNNDRGIAIKKDLNHDGDTNDANETISGCKIGTYDANADNITATQKILVTVIKDPASNKFRIKRFEYID